MLQMKDINWYSLLDTLLGELNVEYRLEASDNHIAIEASPENLTLINSQLEKAFNDLSSVLPYTVEAAPLVETVPEAMSTFKALLGDERFTDLTINPDELFNIKRGAQVKDGVLYSKATYSQRTISVWTDAINALIADLKPISKEALREKWKDKSPISRLDLAKTQDDIDYTDIVKQNFGLQKSADNKVSVFFNFRQLWQDLFVPELASKSKVVSAPLINTALKTNQIVIHKAQLLDYLRQELHSDMLWRIFQTDQGPVATPLYLDTTTHVRRQTKVSIIIDRSGSMKGCFEELTTKVLGFIEKLEPNTRVNILFFDDTIGPRQAFLAHDLPAITNFVKSLKPNGQTYLYQALKAEFDNLLKDAAIGDNTAILLVTDGQESSRNYSDKIDNILAIQTKFKEREINPPKIFTIGIGADNAIQKLDPRLSSERLIINNVAEFKKVHQYIQQIQNPTRDQELIVTPKPNAVVGVNVAVEQHGNIIAPDVYFSLEHHSMGVIQSNKKLIIKLKSNIPQGNIHDTVKRILALARDAVVSKPYHTLKNELTTIKAKVAASSLAAQGEYPKSILDDLIQLLETDYIQMADQSHQKLIKTAQHQRSYVEHAIPATPTFSMDYTSSTDGTSIPYTGAWQRMSPPQYNIAGKLISSHDKPTEEALSSLVRISTRIESKQNQMTVQAFDQDQKEQSRLYAFCTPQLDDAEPPFLFCQGDSFQSFVFPNGEHPDMAGDNYHFNQCRPVDYYGKPSVVCPGEKSTVVLTPKLRERPFENLGGNIALGAVLLYWAKSLYQAFTTPTQPKTYFTDKAVFKKKVKELRSFLEATKKKIQAKQPFDGDNFHLLELEDYAEDVKRLEKRFSKDVLEEAQLDELYQEIKDFKDSMHKLCDKLSKATTKAPKPITPQFKLETQKDWGALLLPKSTSTRIGVDTSLPKIKL
ncbi:VWA domain-containing protein [Candidatus Berkiella aquae]|uniref:VWA domain-containing protein n=1 Tax=Candidatus Berkiella aquae TaxID=295108 RepID=A0A0Q9YVT8_9GAMM|nr:VWA domain-containing protein [Candidatus Berkiella aquae]MCS5711283.1 VWA domain-containing protein [Candidatus Berkiella aquae]